MILLHWGRQFFVAALSTSLLWLSGCAHQSTRSGQEQSTDGASQAVSTEVVSVVGTPVKEIPGFRASDPEGPAVADEELEAIPVEINAKVEQWLRYFQGRGRPHMERYLSRSTRYEKLMKRILRQNGLPEDLLYVALIESGFNSKITSRAAAVGYWQFIRGTGRRYGLEINQFVDERRDPVLSTQAAADYFKALYSIFGSWYLAMAAYNVGENRVMREIVRNKTRDFWELARRRRLPSETINYVPKYMAARLIAKDPAKFGFTEIEYEEPIEYELIRVEKPLNLKNMAEKLELEYDELKDLNPKFRGEIAPLKADGKLELRVPLKLSDPALVAAAAASVDQVEMIADAGETLTYRVRRGDSLFTIARRHRTTVAWLRDVNDLRPGRRLRVGMRMQVPDRSSPKPRQKPVQVARSAQPVEVAKASQPVAKADPALDQEQAASTKTEVETKQGTYYIVQAGDTLSSIAEEYDSTVNELRRMNKLRRGRVLRIGMKLKVPKDEALPSDPGVEAPSGTVQEVIEPKVEREPSGRNGSKNERELAKQWTSLAKQYYQSNVRPTKKKKATRVHVVRRGESLLGIANRYGVPLTQLKQKNSVRKPNHLLAGTRLLIPENIRTQ